MNAPPTSPPRRSQAQRSAATRSKLLLATIDCLQELGYRSTTTNVVCKRAGVSRGAQLHHYPSKARLVAAAIERLFEMRHAEFREAAAAWSEPIDVEAVFHKLWEIYSGPTSRAWIEVVIASRTDAELGAAVRGVNERFLAEASKTFDAVFPGVRGRSAALHLILSTFDGLALSHMLAPAKDRNQQALDLFRQLAMPLLCRDEKQA